MVQTSTFKTKVLSSTSDWKRWLGVIPFFLFAFLFLILPSLRLFVGSFTNNAGQFTLSNILELFRQPFILNAYWLSIRISAVTALGGGIFGFLLAYAVTIGDCQNRFVQC